MRGLLYAAQTRMQAAENAKTRNLKKQALTNAGIKVVHTALKHKATKGKQVGPCYTQNQHIPQ